MPTNIPGLCFQEIEEGNDQPATCVMKTGSERQKNARLAIQSHDNSLRGQRVPQELLSSSVSTVPPQSKIIRATSPWWQTAINHDLITVNFMKIFGPISPTVTQSHPHKWAVEYLQLEPAFMDGESHLGLCPKGPRYSEPRAVRLAINSLLQPSLSSLCGTKRPYVHNSYEVSKTEVWM